MFTKSVYINRLLLLVLAFSQYTCAKHAENDRNTEDTSNYFPLVVGSNLEYKVEDIQIDVEVGKSDTNNYLEKNIIVAEETINSAHIFIIDRYRKIDPTEQWQYEKTYHVRKQADEIVCIEDNVPYKIAELPMQNNRAWDYNIYNSFNEIEVLLDSLYTSYQVLNKQFDSILIISSEDFESLYTRTFLQYKLAKNVGLISYIHIDVESQFVGGISPNFSLPLMERITKGRILKKVITGSNSL